MINNIWNNKITYIIIFTFSSWNRGWVTVQLHQQYPQCLASVDVGCIESISCVTEHTERWQNLYKHPSNTHTPLHTHSRRWEDGPLCACVCVCVWVDSLMESCCGMYQHVCTVCIFLSVYHLCVCVLATVQGLSNEPTWSLYWPPLLPLSLPPDLLWGHWLNPTNHSQALWRTAADSKDTKSGGIRRRGRTQC